MKHSRPGFAPRQDDTAPAALNSDMVPALHRKTVEARPSPVRDGGISLSARLEAHAKMPPAPVQTRAQIPIEPAPQVIVNPEPSAPPHVNEPGK
jgi:hypothetical protein